MRRCASCGRFVSKHHLATNRYFYDIDPTLPVAVYSLAAATRFQSRLDCPGCSMTCCRMTEAARDYGVAVGRSLPNGWEKCSPTATQANYIEGLSMSDPHAHPTFHASGDGTPFGSTLCGFTPENGEGVWVTQIRSDVNCHLCLEVLGA